MIPFRVVAIPESVAEAVRASGRAPGYGHPAHTEVARGHGPCRLCLRSFAVGSEQRTLFTYDSFAGVEPLPLPGPVYIHAAACARHAEESGVPDDLRQHPLTLFAYGRGRQLRQVEPAVGRDIEPAIERLLARADVDYIQAHNTEAGCYDFRVERAGDPG